MLARFVGGPWDGQVKEIRDETSEVSQAVPAIWESMAFEQIRYHRTHWTRDGCRLFVVEGYDRSPIGDEEIEAAARWLAEQMAGTDSSGQTYLKATDAHGTRFRGQEGYRGLLTSARDRAGVDQSIGATVSPQPWIRFRVKVAPGLVLGYRGDEAEPCWRWPSIEDGRPALVTASGRSE